LGAALDGDAAVQEQIQGALCALGDAEPGDILRLCDEYLRQHDKVGAARECWECWASWECWELCPGGRDFPLSQEVIWEWQEAASAVLVALGRRFINRVMEELLGKFQPGILPHYFVLHTFANLATANG
ncbi:MROH1 protein, partial [Furnarius figulus]|nr:MROH1 protein [Furnarius figulus]